MAAKLIDINYPVLLWRKGYTYLATSPFELCVHPRSLFNDTVQRTVRGEWRMVDAAGKSFDLVAWEKIKPFGGLKGVGMRLIGSIFAAPVLENEHSLPLGEFKKKLTGAVIGRYKNDLGSNFKNEIVKKIREADSYAEAIGVLPRI